LNHLLQESEYKSAIISGLAVLGIRDDDGWLDAEDYTPKYSVEGGGGRGPKCGKHTKRGRSEGARPRHVCPELRSSVSAGVTCVPSYALRLARGVTCVPCYAFGDSARSNRGRRTLQQPSQQQRQCSLTEGYLCIRIALPL